MRAISLLLCLFAYCSVAKADVSSYITTSTPTAFTSVYTAYISKTLTTIINRTLTTVTTSSAVLTLPAPTASGLITSTIYSTEIFTTSSCKGIASCLRTTVVTDIRTYTVSTGYSTSTITSASCVNGGFRRARIPVTTFTVESYVTTCLVSTTTSTAYETTTVTTTTGPPATKLKLHDNCYDFNNNRHDFNLNNDNAFHNRNSTNFHNNAFINAFIIAFNNRDFNNDFNNNAFNLSHIQNQNPPNNIYLFLDICNMRCNLYPRGRCPLGDSVSGQRR